MKPCVCCVMDEGLKLNCCVVHDVVVLMDDVEMIVEVGLLIDVVEKILWMSV